MGSYVLGFQEIDQTQVAVVGGKGAHLGGLSRMTAFACRPTCPTCWLLGSSDFDGRDTVGVELSDQVGSKIMRLADHDDGVSVDLGAVVGAGMRACA